MLAVIDFLNSREKATVVWSVVVLAYVWRNDRSIGGSILQVLRSVFDPKLSLLWAIAAAYSTVIAFAACAAGLWHATAIKETIYWFVGTGTVLAGEAVSGRFDRAFVNRVAAKALRITIIIEFVTSVYVMPLGVEMFLVPLASSLVVMQYLAHRGPQVPAARPVLDGAVTLLGLGVITYAIARAVSNLGGLVTREHAELLLLAPAFTLAFIPCLYAMWRWSRWDEQRAIRRWREERLSSDLPEPK